MDKKALKQAALIAAIVLAGFEALCFLVQLIDPQGGLLRVDMRSAVPHAVIVIAALAAGIGTYIRERKKNRE